MNGDALCTARYGIGMVCCLYCIVLYCTRRRRSSTRGLG